MCITNKEKLRLHHLKEKYAKKKLEQLSKFEVRQQLKHLTKKKKKKKNEEPSDSEEYFSDNVSCSDNNDDKDYVPDSPESKVGKCRSLIQKTLLTKRKLQLSPPKSTPKN